MLQFLFDSYVWWRHTILNARRLSSDQGKIRTYAVNFAYWKRAHIEAAFPDRSFFFIGKEWTPRLLGWMHSVIQGGELFVWGTDQYPGLQEFLRRNGMPVTRIEDGFVRSVGLGAEHHPPLSLCIDRRSIYYDARQPSELDRILAEYEFSADPDLLQEARDCLALIRKFSITKYNLAPEETGPDEANQTDRIILCIGQVEDDQSILFGAPQPIDNNELVRMAARENPGARLIYKVHPDYLAGKRQPISDPQDVAHLCAIVGNERPLTEWFARCDRLYTITSLTGFEALVHGVPVTTLGMPFYAGWGLTDDRQPQPSWRGRQLSLEELFAAAYLKYPTYFAPPGMQRSTLRETIARILDATGRSL